MDIKELQKIYDSEINISISWFWDSGIDFQLGDEGNGFKWEDTFWTIEDGMKELIKQIKKFYPNSNYIKEKKEY